MGEINTIYVKAFEAFIDNLPQQTESIFRSRCKLKSGVKGEDWFDDFILKTSRPHKVLSRNEDTPIDNQEFDRRKVTMDKYNWGWLFDDLDQLQMLVDPTSEVMTNALSSFNREIDYIMTSAALGTAYKGKAGGTSVVLPDANKIVHGGAGLTVEKLRLIRKFFDNNFISKNEDNYFAWTGTQKDNLLTTTEVTSADYNTVRALTNGQIDTFLGFKFVLMDPDILPTLSTDATVRRCIAWTQSSLRLCFGADIQRWIEKNVSKQGNPHAYMKMTLGGTRRHEYGLMEVQCKEL